MDVKNDYGKLYYLKIYFNEYKMSAFCYVLKQHPDAVLPFKTNNNDAGYDLTIVSNVKQFNSVTTLYDTGIQLHIPTGYYVEIMARSSLSNTGYMLANNTAIIDNGYRGNILIALTKIAPEADPIELPFRCCQLIFKKQHSVPIKESMLSFAETQRNTGGFGSTGK